MFQGELVELPCCCFQFCITHTWKLSTEELKMAHSFRNIPKLLLKISLDKLLRHRMEVVCCPSTGVVH